MAKQDIRLDLGFYAHGKTKRLRRRLGDSAIIALQKLWIYAAVNHQNGFLPMDTEGIAEACDWDGDCNEFVSALLQGLCPEGHGFLDKVEGGFELHDWGEHQPWIAHSPERSEAARRAVGVRWGKVGNTERIQPVSNGNTPSPTPTPTPTPNQKRSTAAADEGYSPEFERFWKTYPRRVAKDKAWRAWRKAKALPPVEELITAVEQHMLTDQWRKDRGEFIPHPATWLNQRRWEDEPIMQQQFARQEDSEEYKRAWGLS
jgi:hypothetical protein